MENQTNFEVVSDEELAKINWGVALELTREGYYNQYGGPLLYENRPLLEYWFLNDKSVVLQPSN